MTLYKISEWTKQFENNRTRQLQKMDWIPVPNKHDGDGFTDLISRPDGPALYGAWILILQVASKCVPRGTLCRTISSTSRTQVPDSDEVVGGAETQLSAGGCGLVTVPHTPATIARITRCPEELIKRALDVCQEIGWIEVTDALVTRAHPGAEKCDPAPRARDARAERNGTERNGREPTEGKGTERNSSGGVLTLPLFTPSPRFADWWQLWSSVKGTNHRNKAEDAYREVPQVAELDCFECTVSYLQSLDNPAKGYHPENFLAEQGKEKFKARWPQSTSGRKGPTVDELADSIDAFRRTR